MELRDYLRIVRAHWIVIILATALGAGVAFGWSLLQPKVYTADATGIVTATSNDGSTGSALIGNQLAQSRVKSYLNLGSWRAVAEHAIDELGLDTSPESLVSRVTLTNPIDTTVLKVTATGSTPEDAQKLAEAWMRGMAAEISTLEGGTSTTPGAVTLTVGDSARLPSAPSSPNMRLNVLLGAGVGLALGLAYAFLRHMLDRRVRHPRDIERETGVSVIGTLPLEKNLSGERQVIDFSLGGSDRVSHHTVEAIRELRTNLQFIDVDNPPRVIVVTSSVPGDGKSTVSVNLASSLAAAGQWAILIDCDLRRPVIADIFGMSKDAGLTDILAGRAQLEDVTFRPQKDTPLAVIGAGRIPPNPSELLGSQRMRDFVRALSESAIVILDSPPVLPVTDAAVLAGSADGVIIIASSGKTTFDMLQRAVANITRSTGRVLGIVLNRVPRKGSASAYYGREYYGTFEEYTAPAPRPSADDAPPPRARRSRATQSS
ncbi:polysaccharide biosynthesis tyrosine autokinase [Microbacterium keratanolyticum]|uniref:polysaccharide biosynthesis tyrosine autokinase n=1 Tax=Microbacterium keratanolyticum TaxID=67574 RepID=UPI00362F0B26